VSTTEIALETNVPAQQKLTTSSQVTRRKLGRARATNEPGHLASPTPLRQARRRRDLVNMFVAAIGPAAVTDLMMVTVKRAAELTVACEAARAAVLNGGANTTEIENLIKLEGECRRATKALGIKLDAKPAHIPLRDQLAAEIAEGEDGEVETAA
jgi:hypothetical protein